MAKRKRHGGRRPGAGRPPLAQGHTSRVTVTLPARHIALVEHWQDEHDCETFSEALRQIIEAVVPRHG